MSTIQEQLKLEKEMVGHGIAKYLSSMQASEDKGRGHDTTYAKRMTKEMMGFVAEYLQEKINRLTGRPGRKARYYFLLKDVDTMTVAYIALCGLFDQLLGVTAKSDSSLTSVCRVMGDRIHDEIRFSAFKDEHKDYYSAIIEDFKRKGTIDYRHMHRVLTNKANEKQVKWTSWTETEQIHVGQLCIEAILETTDLIEVQDIYINRKTKKIVRASDTLLDWINKHKEFMQLLAPETGPMVVAPIPWTAWDQGGFYTPQLQNRHKMIKVRSKAAIAVVKAADLSLVQEGLNAVQDTPWRVNGEVLDNIKEVWDQNKRIGMPASQPIDIPACPLEPGQKKADVAQEMQDKFDEWSAIARNAHNEEHKRRSKCIQLSRVISMATKYRDYEGIWFCHTNDSRGRVYATSSSFHPQGADFSKGLLTFKRAKVLGEDGLHWFKVHGANKSGNDGGTYDERVSWVEQNHERIIHTSLDPLSHGSFWDGDKSYQFLAWCHEYRRAYALDDPRAFKSKLPIALDGSCNGLQNFSAMLRDAVGGAATNLIPSATPSDIYAAVCHVLNGKIGLMLTDETASKWSDYGIERGLSKKPVMTLPYGSTRSSCTDSILAHIRSNKPMHFGDNAWQAAQWLTPPMWESIGDVVIAARAAMDWLQTVSRILTKHNEPVVWTTSLGFPVYQAKYKQSRKRVYTQLLGGIEFSLAQDTDDLCSRQQSAGISPNFVHSQDATHMLRVAARARKSDMDLAMIHDDFGTHACDIPEFNKIIREEFVSMYEVDVLQEFKDQIERETGIELPALPPKGDLDINGILNSPYFFG